ncbi:MAG: nitroreductase [Burkholderiales bacterium]|nr:MAG: nitroreductase [Burkholderiales bacterium]
MSAAVVPVTPFFPSMSDPSDLPSADWPALANELLHARRTVLPRRLTEPGPDAVQRQAILAAASAAPDHGQLLPWRFIEVPRERRELLAQVFAQALFERDAAATADELERAREKAHRAPWLMLVVVDALRGDRPDIDLAERIFSAGCAVQNILLMATALGYGSALTSGKALKSDALRRLFGLGAAEQALCFISIGSVASRKPGRSRPSVSDYHSCLGQPDGAAGS